MSIVFQFIILKVLDGSRFPNRIAQSSIISTKKPSVVPNKYYNFIQSDQLGSFLVTEIHRIKLALMIVELPTVALEPTHHVHERVR